MSAAFATLRLCFACHKPLTGTAFQDTASLLARVHVARPGDRGHTSASLHHVQPEATCTLWSHAWRQSRGASSEVLVVEAGRFFSDTGRAGRCLNPLCQEGPWRRRALTNVRSIDNVSSWAQTHLASHRVRPLKTVRIACISSRWPPLCLCEAHLSLAPRPPPPPSCLELGAPWNSRHRQSHTFVGYYDM